MSQQSSQDGSFGDIDSFLDFDNNTLFTSPSATRSSFSSSPSPSMSQSSAAAATEFQAPSHPYGLHLQQTDVDVLGIGLGDGYFGESQAFMNLDTDMSGSSSAQNSSLPPYFYPEQPATTSAADAMSQGISPMMTIGELVPKSEPPAPAPAPANRPQRVNYYPGYHQEMAAYNENVKQLQAQQKLAQQKAAAEAAARAAQHPQQAKIDALLDSFKSPANPNPTSRNANDILPHIARMKKEEDEMDEDERLLASEEGKKLSSKERRQLRNKVSARAFRSRRKEYISQLEAEVAKKTQEAQAAKDVARRVEEENARLRGFTEMLMKHSAFQEFIRDMTVPLTNPAPQQVEKPAPVSAAPVETIPTYNPTRDVNPNVSAADQWPLAYSNWPTTTTTTNTHVYAVELPDTTPAIQDLNGKMIPFEEEDYTVSDGFFSHLRNEKADIDFSLLDDDEDVYQPPENLEDLYPIVEEEKQQSKNLDDLFPGVSVTSFLERLEMVVGGEARPEDVFELVNNDKVDEVMPQTEQMETVTEEIVQPALCRSNMMLQEAEGVYRRIGLAVGGQ